MPPENETRELWNELADDWRIQVGHDGDSNRRLNSDPVLRQFAGDVTGLTVLDAGCGVGYLTAQLARSGAHAIGVDFAEQMIANARLHYPALDFRVDSCTELATIPDASCDLVISNYVLMDTPDLDDAVLAFHRVLKPGGAVVAVFSHPCFPASYSETLGTLPRQRYVWGHSYFEPQRCVDPPWNHFKSEFIWFHRPLSGYWKSFTSAGFQVEDFEEPRLDEERAHLAPNPAKLLSSRYRPLSVAFKLRKP